MVFFQILFGYWFGTHVIIESIHKNHVSLTYDWRKFDFSMRETIFSGGSFKGVGTYSPVLFWAILGQ